ncbi:MAG: helix-turn-helix domain-containing protein [Thaumarchaeota archaeon]|jgi:DNA-binding MarR family transcriptional regulator|nr:helix-turn-helix domain-containing protein [Candidatus Geocrenenecus arthurdayi]MCL7391048.1 helix-turn-helix domain-containing protein [Candidatus Geocrenenecus arthurdayi]MCL7396730.1 helix-turn-helix domain-containing protein [Candidatus Geocrenenecus arthurdayi]MCL7402491.1 helix-turn-helix domain-containing protein [Candidatus Geocrenenecus arthurdayi]MCL7402973.1 helix-turn-helix domain-containing protein [Candidatus Geocrenenecus arthurdayi]
MDSLTFLVFIFSILFIVQTTIYTYLLLRFRKMVEESFVKSRISQEAVTVIDEGKLNESIIKVLEVLSRGSMSAREVSVSLGLSREHTARLLKKMVEAGLVVREGKPYKYKVTPSGKTMIETYKKA